MYKDYFRFNEMPFSIAPDPRFLYLSAQHRDALAHLLYGVQGEGGFVLLTGEVGTGKTTLCRCLLDQIDAECDVAYILNPKMSAVEMLATVCEEFHIAVAPGAASIKAYVDALNAHLLRVNAQSRRAVLIIDEAQNLAADVLEQLRLLTNLETSTRKLLQIILIGQPELQAMLRRSDLRQVAQRIVARYHLSHLARRETAAYVAHRLSVAGSLAPLFPRKVLAMVHRHSGGVPRLINLICDRALLGTFAQGRFDVDAATLRKAAREVLGGDTTTRRWTLARWQAALLALLGAGGVLAAVSATVPSWQWHWPDWKPTAAPPAAATAAPPTGAIETSPPVPETAAASAITEATPPLQAALRWPAEIAPHARSEALAFRDLLKRYGVEYDPAQGAEACEAAKAARLRCHTARGEIVDVQRFNQPALVTLGAPASGERFHAVLVSLTPDAATLELAGTTQRVTPATLAALWSGDYVVLWKPPPGYAGPLTEGSRGRAVSWLRHALARVQDGEREPGADGKADEKGAGVFDVELLRRVKTFQAAQGIEADGIAGELTFTLLNRRLDRTLPQLNAPAVGG